jgi:hypothetical protein
MFTYTPKSCEYTFTYNTKTSCIQSHMKPKTPVHTFPYKTHNSQAYFHYLACMYKLQTSHTSNRGASYDYHIDKGASM